VPVEDLAKLITSGVPDAPDAPDPEDLAVFGWNWCAKPRRLLNKPAAQ
jgi:hypothetical protein